MQTLVLKKLVKDFRGFRAVNNLSFEIKKGRVVGFLGPNGAGKTTTIRTIVGLSRPTKGEIFVGGEKVNFGDTKTNKSIGYLPELPSFYNWMSGQEYMDFVANIFGLTTKEKDKKIGELLKKVDLYEARNKRISTYSGGMKQRLGIAQALINDPELLIFDEPVSALDPVGRREVLKIIEGLKKDKTVFFSTHVLSDVDRICDDVILINKGNLIVDSPLAELKAKYAASILEVEFIKDPAELLPLLKNEVWAGKFEKNGNQLKIWLKDEKDLDSNLPLIFFSKQKIGILKYGLTLPETEDLFMQLLGDDK